MFSLSITNIINIPYHYAKQHHILHNKGVWDILYDKGV